RVAPREERRGGAMHTTTRIERPEPASAPAPWGMLAAIDLDGCPYELLADGERIRAFVADVIPAIGMVAHGPTLLERFGDGDLEGWSAMQFIETSSVTIHADEHGGRCFVDVFSCKAFDPALGAAVESPHCGAEARVPELQRGTSAAWSSEKTFRWPTLYH